MPTYYEGEPIFILEYKLEKEDFQNAWILSEKMVSIWSRPSIKAGLSLTLVLLIASAIPYYLTFFSTVWIPIIAIGFLLFVSFFFFYVQPKMSYHFARTIFESNLVLSLSQKVFIYRDSMICENEKERFVEYWTDFTKCIESEKYYILIGGIVRSPFILPKRILNEEQKRKLSEHLKNTFASRYQKGK